MIQSEKALMHRLIEEGFGVSAIARRLGHCRQTIYNWRKKKESPEAAPARTRRKSKLDPFKSFIESTLRRFDLPATTVLEKIRKQGYEGGITILRDFVAGVKEQEVRRVVERFETEPGRQAQVDWGSCGTILHEGRRRRLSLLVVVLGHSRTIWARFVVSERRPILLELLELAFRQLGGVPKELLVDNMKQAIDLVRTADRDAKVNEEFQHFADHWGFDVVACPPYWPRAKGKVERAIQYLKRSFLEGCSFTDLDDLNAQLVTWLAETANVRIHGTIKVRPVDRLAADQEAMRSLAAEPFQAAVRAERRVDHDAFISYCGVRYSVDPSVLGRRRGEPVEVLVGTDERLRVYHRGRRVGEHAIVPSGSPPQEDPRHAAERRRLRQRPHGRPRGKTPRFEQLDDPTVRELGTLVANAPHVVERPLATYEGST